MIHDHGSFSHPERTRWIIQDIHKKSSWTLPKELSQNWQNKFSDFMKKAILVFWYVFHLELTESSRFSTRLYKSSSFINWDSHIILEQTANTM